jgi:exopolysaccharide production protein ExoZ
MKARLHQIDQLRGLAACGIMLFHFISFQYGELSSQDILGRIGLYGVSLFYVISGIALGHIYGSASDQKTFPYRSFFIKRYARLMPLFILATIIAIVASRDSFELQRVVLNLAGLFSLLDYDGGIATGSWSIGNEWVFYLLLPAILALMAVRNKWIPMVIALAIFLVFCAFAWSGATELTSFWPHYIHPFNHLIFFVAGVGFGKYQLHQRPINWQMPVLGGSALLCFILWPASGDRIALVTGTSRLVLSATTILFALAWYRINIRFWTLIEKSLLHLGDWSYSIYMLHPLVWALVVGLLKKNGWNLTPETTVALCCALTIGASSISYRWLERPCMQWVNRRWVSKKNIA